jgi:hypothetical protein
MNNMKRGFFLSLVLGFWAIASLAQVQPTDTNYMVSLHTGYAHNLTYGSYATFDVDAYMPIHQHFDMQVNLRTSTANSHSLGVQLRPKFALPVGELYIEDRLMMRFVARDEFNEFLHAISLGYMMEYVNVQVGVYTRVIQPLPYIPRSEDELICEPFDVLYRVEAFVRPRTSPWNISLALSNVDNYQIERMWQPMFYLGGWYDINEHWRVRMSGKLKLAGMFHLNAHYYASELRVGAEYRF